MPGLQRILRMAELRDFLPTALDEDELPDYIWQRRNRDLLAPSGSQTWGPELLGFCQQANLLILDGSFKVKHFCDVLGIDTASNVFAQQSTWHTLHWSHAPYF